MLYDPSKRVKNNMNKTAPRRQKKTNHRVTIRRTDRPTDQALSIYATIQSNAQMIDLHILEHSHILVDQRIPLWKHDEPNR